jgi:uncharacterized protein (TIGR02391 family)
MVFLPQGTQDSAARADIETLKKQIADLASPTSKTPEKLMILFDALVVQAKIREASRSLFGDRHYSQAIFEAYKTLEFMVKEKSGLRGIGGKPLMAKAFDIVKPILKLNDANTDGDKDEQIGFMHIFMGVMTGIRNPKGHEAVVQKDPIRTLQYLAFADLLAHRIDEAVKVL